MKKSAGKASSPRTSDGVFGTLEKIIPGFHGLLKKVEGSKTFGPKITEIRKEIDRRFGGGKK